MKKLTQVTLYVATMVLAAVLATGCGNENAGNSSEAPVIPPGTNIPGPGTGGMPGGPAGANIPGGSGPGGG